MKIIDLSKTIYDGMDVYFTDPKVKIEKVHTYEDNNWELRKLTLGTHTGTHVDAFSHMHRGKESIDDIDVSRFIGRAKVYSKYYKICEENKNIGLLFIEEVGLEILEKLLILKPPFVGGNLDEDLERELLDNDIITYTDLINLDKLPKDKIFTFIGLPLKIKSGDGSPVRAIAILDD